MLLINILKKILIISYFYPPSNFVGGDRVAAWAKYLHEFGYYPTIITRNWNDGQKELTDKINDNTLKHEVFDTYEVYYLPYKRTLRDKLNDYPNSILKYVRKSLSFIELIASNFFLSSIPYNNFYCFAKSLIQENPNKFSFLIASGRPFQLFHIANKLHKNTQIRWFADYRDEWNTFQNNESKSFLNNLIGLLEKQSEKKWTTNSTAFITVSEYWEKSIRNFIKKPGFVVMNGYDIDEIKKIDPPKTSFDSFCITYAGTMYPSQDIEVFIKASNLIILKYQSLINIKINFIGIEVMPNQKQRILNLIGNNLNKNYFILPRLPKNQLLDFYEKSDMLLATGFSKIRGWYPVKIFEYSATGIPILLCPGDKDVLDEYIYKTQCGEIAHSTEECFEILSSKIEEKLNKILPKSKLNIEALKIYSRKHQTKLLSEILNKHIQ